jgi:hypothetical protein
MRSIITLSAAALLLLGQAVPVWAQTALSLTVSATLPSATGLQLTVTPINATTGVAGVPSTSATTIPFGTLTFNSTNNIYLPANFYSVAIGTTGGAGTPIVNVTYAEGNNPNNPGTNTNGLGTKTTATFVTVNGSGAETISSLGKKRLIDLTGTAGELSTIPSGSYEKVYVGIWTGSTASPADPSNGKPFSNLDVGGTYTGTLTFTEVTP